MPKLSADRAAQPFERAEADTDLAAVFPDDAVSEQQLPAKDAVASDAGNVDAAWEDLFDEDKKIEQVAAEAKSDEVGEKVPELIPILDVVAADANVDKPAIEKTPKTKADQTPTIPVLDANVGNAVEKADQKPDISPVRQTGGLIPLSSFDESDDERFTGLRPSIPYRKSLGGLEVSLLIDWVTPETILLGQEATFELVLRNSGRTVLENLAVEQVLPAGFRLVKATPVPVRGGDQPVWRIAKIDPHQEARISLQLVPGRVGNAQSHARVNFSTVSAANFRVVEPKLELIAEGPKKVIVGNQAVFTITVRNPGSGKTRNTIVKAELPEGLLRIAKTSTYELGVLNPGESRSIQILAKVTELGQHVCKFTATTEGGLRDQQSKLVLALGAKLELTVEGPNFRYVTRPADFTVRIKNSGTTAAHNVHLRCSVPKAFAYLAAADGGRFDNTSKTINWYVGRIDEGKEFVGRFRLRALNSGKYPIFAQAVAERGLTAESQHLTRVEGIAAILLEVVDVYDPIEVGADTFYEILVTNQGTAFATGVQIIAKIPDGMTIIGAKGPTRGSVDGQTIRFAVLPRLAPRADAIYRIKVRGNKPGDFRIEVQATAGSLNSPVTELESTKVYQD